MSHVAPPSIPLRERARRALKPVAAPFLSRIYLRVDARTDERLETVFGQAGGTGSAVTDEHLRALLDAMSEQNAALHSLRREVAELRERQDRLEGAAREDGKS
jgi:hypothetical protein